jgi:hypothetical protein
MLSSYLGPYVEYNGVLKPNLESLQPVFVHVDFTTHDEAWEAFELLTQAIRDDLPIRISWIKTSWYYSVAEKDRLWRLKSPDIQRLADEGVKGMEDNQMKI